MIIGLSGYARSGKDTAAHALVGHGYNRVAFADKLREFLLRLNPIVDTYSQFRVSDVIEQYGWDGYKESGYGAEIRELLQRLGTECGRELISDTIWIDAALNGTKGRDIVVTDVRFPNEAQAIKDRGGYVIRVVRPGVGPANSHPSETALDDWDFDAVILNDGSVGELQDNMAGLAYGLR